MRTLEVWSEFQNRPDDGVALAFRRRVDTLLLGQGLGKVANGCSFRRLGLILLLKEESTDAVISCVAVDHLRTNNLGKGAYRRINQVALQCVEGLLLIIRWRDRVVPAGRAVLLKHVGKRGSDLCEVLHEEAVDFARSKDASHDLRSLRERGVFYRPDRLRVSVDTQGSRSDAVAKVRNFFLDLEAHIHLELDACVLQKSQHRIQMSRCSSWLRENTIPSSI